MSSDQPNETGADCAQPETAAMEPTGSRRHLLAHTIATAVLLAALVALAIGLFTRPAHPRTIHGGHVLSMRSSHARQWRNQFDRTPASSSLASFRVRAASCFYSAADADCLQFPM